MRLHRSSSFLLARLAIGVVLFVAVATQVDWKQVGTVIGRASPALLGVALFIATADRVIMAAKWCFLLRRLGVPARLRDAIHSYYWGGLVGTALQWSLGGDVARGAALGRAAGATSPVAASIVIEKLAGLAALGCVVALSLPALEGRLGMLPAGASLPLILLGVVVVAVTPAVIAFALAPRAIAWAGRAVPRLRRTSWFPPLHTALVARPRLGRSLAAFFLFTLAEQGVALVHLLAVAQALALPVGPEDVAVAAPTVLFVARLPISVDALGVYEGMFVLLARVMGLSNGEALALALTDRALGLIAIALGLAVLVPLGRLAASGSDRLRRGGREPLHQA